MKLTDFGISKIVENLSALNVNTFCGTVRYMAPELMESLKSNHLVDIWSLGVTVVEMLNGNHLALWVPFIWPVGFREVV